MSATQSACHQHAPLAAHFSLYSLFPVLPASIVAYTAFRAGDARGLSLRQLCQTAKRAPPIPDYAELEQDPGNDRRNIGQPLVQDGHHRREAIGCAVGKLALERSCSDVRFSLVCSDVQGGRRASEKSVVSLSSLKNLASAPANIAVPAEQNWKYMDKE
jgi:hypothetical protein